MLLDRVSKVWHAKQLGVLWNLFTCNKRCMNYVCETRGRVLSWQPLPNAGHVALRRCIWCTKLPSQYPYIHCVCVCVHKCRIICSSGPLGLSWLFGWRCSGFGGLSITQTPRTLIMLMICHSFGAVEKLCWNSRVIHVAFPSKRSACDFSLWPFLLLLLIFPLPFSFAVSLRSVCERAHLHFEPLCSLLSSLLLPARRRRTTTKTENHKEGCNRTL